MYSLICQNFINLFFIIHKHITQQIFFNVWKKYRLKKVPKIVLLESNQIIPDKNLFGQNNFVSNSFDVLIQLGNIPKQQSRATRDEKMIQKGHESDNDSVDSMPCETYGNRDGEVEHVASMSDVYEMNNNGPNLNQLQANIDVRSNSASIDVGRRETNASEEGCKGTYQE